MAFNATFSNISVISWRSVLLLYIIWFWVYLTNVGLETRRVHSIRYLINLESKKNIHLTWIHYIVPILDYLTITGSMFLVCSYNVKIKDIRSFLLLIYSLLDIFGVIFTIHGKYWLKIQVKWMFFFDSRFSYFSSEKIPCYRKGLKIPKW
jgi:hypothetical protein